MNLDKLHDILNDCTVQLRKGPSVYERDNDGIHTVTLDMNMPADLARDDLVKIDMEFLVIGVDKDRAESHREEFIQCLREYPEPDQLSSGPSYIAVGGVLGDQGAAFQFFALGKVLGLWDVITPEMMGAKGEDARKLAGLGYIMCTGWRP